MFDLLVDCKSHRASVLCLLLVIFAVANIVPDTFKGLVVVDG